VSPRTLTVQAAAYYLSSTVKFVRSLIWTRQLPYLKVGKRFVIDQADLDRWIDQNKQTA
jgi:excisionase family DNA binding protein